MFNRVPCLNLNETARHPARSFAAKVKPFKSDKELEVIVSQLLDIDYCMTSNVELTLVIGDYEYDDYFILIRQLLRSQQCAWKGELKWQTRVGYYY